MKLIIKIALGIILALVLLVAGCGALVAASADGSTAKNAGSNSSEDVTVPAGAEKKPEASFKNGVLTTPDLKIKITNHKVIPAGAKGNEYGDKPVLALWYKTTKLGDGDLDPTDFIFHFSAFQDNDPNAENELEVGSLPDDRFLDSQLEKIKKGGTVENAVSYELDDLVTPVRLVAVENAFDDDELGSITYNLN